MRLAYVSPMPPAHTGIATYSAHLIQALRSRCEVTVFTPTRDATPIPGLQLVEFASDPWRLKELGRHERVLYHVGNNPWQHTEILHAMRMFPGAVCLHDLVLYFLVAGSGKGALLKELLLENPDEAFAELHRIEEESIDADLLRYRMPSRHPCLLGLLEHTKHVLVHNRTSARTLAELGYRGRVDVLPLLHYPVDAGALSAADATAARRELGYGDADFVFGAFGFIGPPKRMDAVFDALARIKAQDSRTRARLLVVGEGDALDSAIRQRDLQSIVKTTGFVTEERFARYLAATDAVVNLRYPSHGETSATLVQAMGMGKACVVTDHAFFGELPDSSVIKVSFAESEVDDIARALDRLMSEPGLVRQTGSAARRHVENFHAPGKVAVRLLAQLVSGGPPRLDRPDAKGGAAAPFSPSAYLEGRARQLVP